MDELERHILNNREGMDIHDPDPGLWSRIGDRLPHVRRSLQSYLWRAAAALFVAALCTAAIVTAIRATGRLNDPQVVEVRETRRYYDSRIQSLYREAAPLLTANPDIGRELNAGMGELDSLSEEIISDLSDNIASSEVVEALIRNYRLRIELLEDMLLLMKENQTEPDKRPTDEL
jgi:hypothetical protein